MTKDFLLSFFLPDGVTDWFDVVRVSQECLPNNIWQCTSQKLTTRIMWNKDEGLFRPFICTFAMSCYDFACFLIATLK